MVSRDFVKDYFRFTLPAIIAQLVVFAVDNVNVAILGTLSDKAISGYTVANQSFDIYSMLALGLTGGFHVYISQLYGKHDSVRYNQVFRLGLVVITVAGLVFSVGMAMFSTPFIKMFIEDGEMIDYGVRYLRIYSFSHMFYGINLLISGAYSIVGKSVVAMYSGMLNCIVCLVSSFTLVRGFYFIPSLGVEGAALAILIGRLAEFAFLIVKLLSKDAEFKPLQKQPPLKGDAFRRVIRTAIPLIGNETLYALAFMIIVKNYGHINERYLACYTVSHNIYRLFTVASYCISPACGAMIGRMLGKGDFARAKENSDSMLKLVFMIQVISGGLMIITSGWIPSLFSLSGDVAKVCSQTIIAKAAFGVFTGFAHAFYNIMRIGGASKFVFLIDGVYSVLGPMMMSYLVSYVFPLPFTWAFVAVEAMNVLKSAIGMYVYKKGYWIAQLS